MITDEWIFRERESDKQTFKIENISKKKKHKTG